MTASGHKKFLFDRDFDKVEQEERARKAAAKAAEREAQKEAEEEDYAEEEYAEPEAPPPPSFSQEDLDQAREQGRAQGRDEATRDMASAIEQRTAQTLEAISGQMGELFEAYALDKEQHSRDAVAVAEVIVRKLFPALNMDKAMDEIEHMIVEAMKRTSGNPQLIIRVAEDMHGKVEARANELAALRGREGTVNVIGDADVQAGDARVEWEGGGMVRDTGLIWREIDDIIERNLGERIEMPEDTPDAAPNAAREAEVEKPAPVGENEGGLAEPPASATVLDSPEGDAQEAPPTETHDDERVPLDADGEAGPETMDEREAAPQGPASADSTAQAPAPNEDEYEEDEDGTES